MTTVPQNKFKKILQTYLAICCGRLTLLMVTKVSVTLKYKWLASQMSEHTAFKL